MDRVWSVIWLYQDSLAAVAFWDLFYRHHLRAAARPSCSGSHTALSICAQSQICKSAVAPPRYSDARILACFLPRLVNLISFQPRKYNGGRIRTQFLFIVFTGLDENVFHGYANKAECFATTSRITLAVKSKHGLRLGGKQEVLCRNPWRQLLFHGQIGFIVIRLRVRCLAVSRIL